ncbi:hypothetical protein V6N13_090531 [Hibiscus sabdariffa]|uniref:Uncharacterized protein n=2 Tax=Hibiscus sabdariffa TaxID=183260 RepID=A0ABR2ACJ6_9ROSI
MSEPQDKAPWSVGFFDFLFDLETCCTAFWGPCVTFGQIAEIVDKGQTSCEASAALYTLALVVLRCPGLYTCFYRSKLRKQYNLEGSIFSDCLLHFFCEPCALTQEYRELENHGFDMYVGWRANVEKNPGLAMPPVVEIGMTK